MQPSQVSAVPAPQAVQVQMAPMPTSGWRMRSKYSYTVKTFGILQIVFAGVTVLACAVKLIFGYYYIVNSFGVPPMCGALITFLPAGILGILSVTTPVKARKSLAIACMVMSILAACYAGINVAIGGAAIANDVYSPASGIHISMDAIILLVGLAELVIAILAAVFCCYVMGELKPFTNTTVRYAAVPGYPMVNQPVPMGYSTGVYAPNMQMMVGQPALSNTAMMMNQPQAQPPSYASGGQTSEVPTQGK